MKPAQADTELEEEHLFNFIVNSLGDELPIDFGENVKVTTDELYEVLAGGGAGEDLDQSRLRDNRGLAPREYRPWSPQRPVRA